MNRTVKLNSFYLLQIYLTKTTVQAFGKITNAEELIKNIFLQKSLF